MGLQKRVLRTNDGSGTRMSKILSINDSTGIGFRSAVVTAETPLINQKKPPTATDIHEAFVSEGVPLAIAAARQALDEAHLDPEDITHAVSTTCTDSANPGFDHLVISALGLSDRVEKVLLHGVGCSGGLAVLRTAANLALGHTARRKPARILCIALEVCTTLVRSELDRINDRQEIRIGATLFSDCGSALILSNDVGAQQTVPIYELHGWDHRTIPDTSNLLRFDVDPMGKYMILLC
jgi:fungal type III polyketide synthase